MATPLDMLRDLALPPSTLAIVHSTGNADYLSFIAERKATLWTTVAGLPQAPQPWPDTGQYDAVILPLPANRETFSFCLMAACSVLAPNGTLYLFGHNDTGIKSSQSLLALHFSKVQLLSIGGHGRLYAASAPVRQDYTLASLQQASLLALPNGTARLTIYPGLFAKGKLDNATAFLLEHLPPIAQQARVLDFACGIGVIAKAVQQMQPNARLTMVDHDALAMAAAGINLPGAERQCVKTPAQIIGSYDLIISNPPIHDGQLLSYNIVEQLITELPRLLALKGAAYLVAQITVPIAKMAAQNKLAATEVAANKSFRITKITHR